MGAVVGAIGLGFHVLLRRRQAWLVDALATTGFTGDLESVFGRGQSVAGVAMLVGSVSGGYIAQITNLGVPYIIRSGILAATMLVAVFAMRDLRVHRGAAKVQCPKSGQCFASRSTRVGAIRRCAGSCWPPRSRSE